MEDNRAVRASVWSPLLVPLFRALWMASLVANIGVWMQNVSGVWLMTTLSPSPVLIALMQTATSFPVVLLGLPSGALADIVDRRKLLMIGLAIMLTAVSILGVLTLLGAATPWLLLALTFVLGLGTALNQPIWQAIMPGLVPRKELSNAVTLGGVGFNIARAIGPALGGIIVAVIGPGAVFLLNAGMFLITLVVLIRWQSSRQSSALPSERVVGALRAGLRYLRHAPPLQAVLVRLAVFISCGSALWALLPLVAERDLNLGGLGYGNCSPGAAPSCKCASRSAARGGNGMAHVDVELQCVNTTCRSQVGASACARSVLCRLSRRDGPGKRDLGSGRGSFGSLSRPALLSNRDGGGTRSSSMVAVADKRGIGYDSGVGSLG